jgi:SAM-dependent methyltransferase
MKPELRHQREAEFHDRVFTDESRSATDRFYSITASSKSFYRNYLLDHCQGRQVLEYGAGPHSHSPLMAPRGARVTGIDISMVAAAQYRTVARQRNVRDIQVCVMNAESLAFADDSFDLICGTGILHHLQLTQCFPEMARALRPGGAAVFIEPLGHNPFINAYRNMTPQLRTVDEHPLLAADLEFARRFFKRVDCTYFHLTSLLAIPFARARWFPRMVSWLDRLDQGIFRNLPFFHKHSWAVGMVMSEPRKAKSEA